MRAFKPLVIAALLVVDSYGKPEVKIGRTTLVGRDIKGLKQEFFGGIPFAEPPLGKLRLEPPVLKTTLAEHEFDASNYGAACLQAGLSSSQMSEDCLTINILRPANLPNNSKLPVLFWVYGGAFKSGSASMFNGSAIVAQSIKRGTPLMYVNFNYRVGPLGFPQGQEADDRRVLNLAMRDELAALEWVHANIGAFGGDKNKVTIFGQSAGAVMTSILFLNSPLERLVRAAILESGSQATVTAFNAERKEVNWVNFVSGVSSCASKAHSGHTFDCLHNAKSSEILAGFINSYNKSQERFPFDPAIDGHDGLLPTLPSRLFAEGKFARIPFVSGTNLDEGTTFAPPTIKREDELRNAIIANYSPPILRCSTLSQTVDKLFKLYPDDPSLGSPFNTGKETFGLSSQFKRASAILGDILFHSLRRAWQQSAARAGVKTYGYLFTQPQPQAAPFLAVTHGSEVPYVYGAPPDQSPSSLRLSTLMIDYWVSFATSLNPNDGKGLRRPVWEPYTQRDEHIIQLNGDDTKMIPDDYRKKRIDFINSDPAVFLHR